MSGSGAWPARLRRLDRPTAWEALVALTALGLFARTVTYGWVLDDPFDIVANTAIRSLANLPAMFSGTVWAASGIETYLYRPLTTLSFAANYAVSGLDPWSYHLANVALHALVSVLVFRLGRLWGLSTAAAGLGALVFAVHPVHVEVVAAAHGRKDLLAAAFVAGTVLTHRGAVSNRRSPAWPVLLFAAGLLSKEVAAAGLLLVAAHDLVLETDRGSFLRRNRVAGIYAAYAVVLMGYALIRRQVTGGLTVPGTSVFDNPLVAAGPASSLATAIVVVGLGLTHLAIPAGLSPDYSFDAIPLVMSPLDPRLLGTLAAIAAVAWLLGRRRTRPWGWLALAWYGLSLLPASNLVVRMGTIFGDRLLYLPSAAFCLAAGAVAVRLGRRRTAPAAIVGAGLLAALSSQSVRYSTVWRDDVALFRWATARVPASTKAHHKLGEELLRRGDAEGAIRSLTRAVEIAPGNEFAARTLAQARTLSAVLPDSLTEADSLWAAGQRLRDMGDPDAAIAQWRAAVARNPAHGPSLAELGITSLLGGDTATAEVYFERAVGADPGLASAWFNLATIHIARNDTAAAAAALREFLENAGPAHMERVPWARTRLRLLEGR